MARGCWGVASITHIVWRTREAARITVLGAGLPVASLASAAAQDPHSEIFTGLEASNNAISGYLGAGHAFGKGLYERRLAGPRGRRPWALRLSGNSVRRRRRSRHDLRRRRELRRSTYRLPVPHPALFLKLFAGVEAEDQSIRRAIRRIRCKAVRSASS